MLGGDGRVSHVPAVDLARCGRGEVATVLAAIRLHTGCSFFFDSGVEEEAGAITNAPPRADQTHATATRLRNRESGSSLSGIAERALSDAGRCDS